MESAVMNANASACAINLPSPAEAMVPISGYYTLDPTIGSFLMVDVIQVVNIPPGSGVKYEAKVTVCTDGENSEIFASADNAFTFSGATLNIPGVADLNFVASTGAMSVSGTISGIAVSGNNPFSPIQPEMWCGTYYRQLPPFPVDPHLSLYAYFASLQINADGSVLFTEAPGDLQPVTSYWYDYGMFVFCLYVGGGKQIFEMGTTTGWGRVAGNAHDGSMLVSIQMQQPAPNL